MIKSALMKFSFLTSLFLIVFSFIFSTDSLAAPKVTLTPTPTPTKVQLPQMSANQTVSITNPVDRDLFVGGKQVDVNTTIAGDSYIAGGEVNIKGQVNGNLIVAGGTVTISGEIKKNLIIAGGQVTVDKAAIIDGYILGAGKELSMSGTVNGPARFAGETITLTSTAQINGDLETYTNKTNIDPAAKITGQKNITENIAKTQSSEPTNLAKRFTDHFSAFNFFFFLAQVIVLLVLLRIIKTGAIKIVTPGLSSPIATLAWGLLRLVVAPFLILILLISVIGAPLGILAAIIYGIGLYLATMVGGIALGQFLFQKKFVNNENIYVQSGLGYLIIFIISFVPVIGPFAKFIAFLFGLGLIFQWEKSLFKKDTASV